MTSNSTTTPRITTPPPPPPTFTITCYVGSTPTFTSMDQAWSASDRFSTCAVEMNRAYTPTLNDLAAVSLYRQFVPDETPPGALGVMLGICVERFATDEEILIREPPVVQGALLLCPGAPHADLLQARANKAIIQDGTHTVGQSMAPGTWSTKPSVRDCYWERTTGGGDIIANNFVSFAPDGVTVTVKAGDGGFVSNGCGVWRKAK